MTAEQWAIIRAKWEADPLLTFEEAGKEFGVSKQAVSKRARDGGWTRRTDGLTRLAHRAHAKADRMAPPPVIEVTPEDIEREREAGYVPVKDRVDKIVDNLRPSAEDERAEIRAAILKKHRTEMDGPRRLAYQALVGKDENGRLLDDEKRAFLAHIAKTTMQALKGVQEMERKAYGLDIGDPHDFGVVIIDRR